MPDPLPVRPSLDGQGFHVVVIGGGINGVAIARECALAGARTLLLEQQDFGSGTTSRATRIIHGGLRYLEHGEFGLVRESLRERERLLRERPHLVRPLEFVLALPSEGRLLRSSLGIRTGLCLYRRFGGRGSSSLPALRHVEALLEGESRLALYSYDDAQCEFPERLLAEWLTEAATAGAVVRNHTCVLKVQRSGGHITGLRTRDQFTGDEFTISADWIVNATGPWVDSVLNSSGIRHDKPLVGGVRGSHIVLPLPAEGPKAAIYTEASDGRPVFLVPWNGMLLVGTTEVRDSGDPARVAPDAQEIQYLLQAHNTLLPSHTASHADILYSFAGIRPLPYVEELAPRAITRRHLLLEHDFEGAAGMISLVGGKLTTAGAVARECARKLKLHVPEPRAVMVAAPPANGIEATLRQWSRQVAAVARLPEASAAAIAEWHGRKAMCIARLAGSDLRMRQPLCPHTEHVVAEAVDAVRHEFAATAPDILLRRVPVALHGGWDDKCTEMAIQGIGAALGWSAARQNDQFEAFEEERAGFLKRPAAAVPELRPQRAA